MSKVDIIIPVYNGQNNIHETINSVLENNYQDFTIIVVDDGSTDNTSGVINEIIKHTDKIKYFYKENGGVSSARNYGIEKSSSPYIAFLDSDDLYDKRFLNEMVNKIESSDTDLVASGYYELIDGSPIKKKSAFASGDFLTNYLISKNKIHISNFLINRDLVLENNIRFDETSSYGEDIEFMSKVISLSKNPTLVKDYLTYYRIDENANSLSKFSLDKVDKDYEFVMRILDDDTIKLTNRQRDALLKHKLVGNIISKLLKAYKLGYDLDEIKSYYKKYEHIIDNRSRSFGARSLKLALNVNKLKKIIS